MKIVIHNTYSKFVVQLPKGELAKHIAIQKELSDELSYMMDGAEFVPHKGGWDGRIRLMSKSGQFPAGLTRKAYSFLRRKGFDVEIDDQRIAPEKEYNYELVDSLEPRDYQKTINELAREHQRGVVILGTGGGKTITSALMIKERGVRTLFVVPDTDLREQTLKVFKGIFKDSLFYKIGKTKDSDICVMNIQGLAKWNKEELKRFKMLIIDEFHHSAATTYKKLNKDCVEAYYRYGLTGTYLRSDGKDLEMQGVLSNVFFEKSTSDLIEEGYLVPPHIEMIEYKAKGMSRMSYQQAYSAITKCEDFAETVALIANKKIQDGLQTLVLVRRVEHGELLSKLIKDSVFLHGSVSNEIREEVKEKFNSKKIQTIIATDIFGEGTDIPAIEALINCRLEKTEIKTKQGIGRALRLNDGKEKAEVVDFMITGQRHLNSHSNYRLKTYRKERAFKIWQYTIDDVTEHEEFDIFEELKKL